MKLESAKPAAMILLGSTLICFFLSVSATFYWGLLMPEGTRAFSPVAMPQGASHSHYASHHASAQGLIEGISTTVGALLMGTVALIFTTSWYFARRRWTVIVDLAGVSIVSTVLATALSAVMAFHHVGYRIPCNHQWFAYFLVFSVPSGLASLLSRTNLKSDV